MALLVACPWADHRDRIAGVDSAFVDFAWAFVLLEDASASKALEPGCAQPDEESAGTAVTLVYFDFGTGDPCSGHRVADSEQGHASTGQASNPFAGDTVPGILCLFPRDSGTLLAGRVPCWGCPYHHERTEKIRVACVLGADWASVLPVTWCSTSSGSVHVSVYSELRRAEEHLPNPRLRNFQNSGCWLDYVSSMEACLR